jgi:hypothetical protein
MTDSAADLPRLIMLSLEGRLLDYALILLAVIALALLAAALAERE